MKYKLIVLAVFAEIVSCTSPNKTGQYEISVIKDIAYANIGDTSTTLDLYIPANDGKKPLPLIIYIHGGGWMKGNKSMSHIPLSSFAEKGYITASINYRLSHVAKFPAAVEDSKAAVRWLKANAQKYNIDTSRVGVWGTSAGGHLSLMVGCADASAGFDVGENLSVSSRVQAVVSFFGPADFSKGHTDFQGGDGPAPLQFLGGTMDEKPDDYKRVSPVTYASNDDPSVLLIHGNLDGTVPQWQSKSMFDKLSEAGATVKFIPVTNMQHGFKGEGWSPSKEEVLNSFYLFFDSILK